MIRLNYNPNTNASKISQNNFCVIIGVGSDVLEEADDFGCRLAGASEFTIRSIHSDFKTYFRCSDLSASGVANTSTSLKYFAMSRNSAAGFDSYQNKTKTVCNAVSTALVNGELFACGSKLGGASYTNNTKYVRFVFIFEYLTEAEIGAIIDLTEVYLTNYGKHLIGNDALELIDTTHSILTTYPDTRIEIPLTTYEGSGQTIHPSVVDIGAELNGYRYWMANTPYPNYNSTKENPSVWGSNDGETFTVPDGITNPITPVPDAGTNADTDIYWDTASSRLYVIYNDYGHGIMSKYAWVS